jgi:hypothetical protein
MSEYHPEHVAERDLSLLEDEVDRRRRNDRRQKWGLFVLAMLLAVTLAIIYVLLHNAEDRAEVSGAQAVTEQTEKKDLAKEAQRALCGTKDTEIFDAALCLKLAEAAEEPIVKPTEAPVTISGPSQAELVAAFRLYCAEGNNCKGADGAEPTADDIAAAFVKFCADGRCTGPEGKQGGEGKAGANAQPLAPEYGMVLAAVQEVCANGACIGPAGANGADGANATPEMVQAAVQTFCANDACRGAKGDKGDKGDPPTVIHVVDPAGRQQTCTPDPPGSTNYTCTYDEKPGPTIPPIDIGGTP